MTAPLEREHGTQHGFGQHMRAGDQVCAPCAEANREYLADARRRKREELAERRERWKRADAGTGAEDAPTAGSEAAVLAAHRSGDLVLGEAGKP